MSTTSVRLPDSLMAGLDEFAKRGHADRSDVLRRAIARGLQALWLDEAVLAYESGRITAWEAARQAHVNLWEFLDELKRRGSGLRTDEDHLWQEIEAAP